MYKIYDNCLPEQIVEAIHDELCCEFFPWYRTVTGYETVVLDQEKTIWKNVVNSSQLVHQFIHNNHKNVDPIKYSSWEPMVINMLQHALNFVYQDWNFKNVDILRSKANIMLNNDHPNKIIGYHNPPHIDSTVPHIVLLYYVNNSDGDTVIFDKSDNTKIIGSIEPKMGRFVVFDGDHYHASMFPQNTPARIVINNNIHIS